MLCTEKETINKIKKHSMEERKYLPNHISYKRLISKMYKKYI